MAAVEENTRLIEPPGSEESGLDPASMSTEESSVSPAPDVTYDTTILESQKQSSEQQQQGSEKAKDSAEGGAEEGEEESAKQKGETGSGAMQEKTVRFEGEKQVEQSVSTKDEEKEEDEWMDILGSGDLQKKVLTNNITVCMYLHFHVQVGCVWLK